MALFSFRHSVKTFSPKCRSANRMAKLGQTAAHLKYITRPQAARVILLARLPRTTQSQTAGHVEQEAQRRKGRVCERFVIALPIETTQGQREALTRAFAERLSNGVAGYVAAIHDQHGNDVNNPHAHFVFFDVAQKSGGRGRPRSTLGLARKHAIEGAAKMWADLHNQMMTGWGFGPESQITHQSYADRGVDQIPTIHEGPAARASPPKNSKPEWRHVDEGHSRAEANAIIRQINQLNQLKDIDDETTYRLGNHDGNHPARCASRIPQQRKCSGRDGETTEGLQPPFIKNANCESVSKGDTDFVDRTARRPKDSGRGPRPPATPASPAPFVSRDNRHPCRRIRRWGHVRRLYRELIMLRDTLKTRLLPHGGQSRLPRPEPQPVKSRSRGRGEGR